MFRTGLNISRAVARYSAFACRGAQNRSNHVGIVGCGAVGASCASSIIHYASAATDISMFDINGKVAEGEVMDLEDEGYFTNTAMHYAPTLEALNKCDIIVITAGAKQLPDEPRTALRLKNAKILKEIIQGLGKLKPTTKLILVTNPVDVMTTLAQEWTKEYLPKEHVIGTGTYLDSQRLRVNLSKVLGMSAKCIHAYVLGEHGDSQIVPRSIITIGGCKIDQYGIPKETLDSIELATMKKAYQIISKKGATNHGIGEAVAYISQSIMLNQQHIIPVSAFVPKYGTYLGWPSVVGSNGLELVLPVQLTEEEELKISKCASIIKGASEEILKTL